jgi:hypothetical protein
MLTATYSIVTLKLEQENMRWNFSALQQYILSSMKNLNHVSSMEFECMLNRLSQFEQYCQQRKVEIFIVPALRKFTREADALLDELDSLNQHCFSILCKLRARLQQVMREGILKLEEVCSSIELCCSTIYARLCKREELVELAERVIPHEEWFDLAASFMSHDRIKRRPLPVSFQDEEE